MITTTDPKVYAGGIRPSGSMGKRAWLTCLVFAAMLFPSVFFPAAGVAGIPEPGLVLYGPVFTPQGERMVDGTLRWTLTLPDGLDPINFDTTIRDIPVNMTGYSYMLQIPLETPVADFPVAPDAVPALDTPVDVSGSVVVMDGNDLEVFRLSAVSLNISRADIGTARYLPLSLYDPEDLDGDGLSDAWERQIIDADPDDDINSIYDVLPEDDFDGDGLLNSTEYANRTDPVINTNPTLIGDVNRDGAISLEDAILSLMVAGGSDTSGLYIDPDAGINGRGRIGLQEAIYILEMLSGMREAP